MGVMSTLAGSVVGDEISGASGGSIASKGVGGAGADTSGAGSSYTGSSGSNLGLVGGALDSLGVTATGWFDRAQQMKQTHRQQQNLDREFEENKRRYGLEWALREFSTRKGISMQEAQILYNQTLNSMQFAGNQRRAMMQEREMREELEERRRRRRAALMFTKGFAQGMGNKKYGE